MIIRLSSLIGIESSQSSSRGTDWGKKSAYIDLYVAVVSVLLAAER